MAQARAGKVKAIASLSAERLPGAEQIEPLSSVLPGFSAAPRLALLAPAGTPAGVVQALSEAVRRTLQMPELVQAAAQHGAVPADLAPDALDAALVRESAQWGRLIKEQRIVAN